MSNWNYASNVGVWTSNRLSNYAPSNYMSNWNYASNTARWTSNRLSNYVSTVYMSNWNYASNVGVWTSNRLSNYAPLSTVTTATYASNLAHWLSNNNNDDYWVYPKNQAYTYTMCNVGIGTSTPGTDLDVVGIARANTLMANSFNTVSQQGAYFQWSRVGGTGYNVYLNQPGLGPGGHSFGTVTANNAYTEWMKLSSHNVLSPTTTVNPTVSLRVDGDFHCLCNLYSRGSFNVVNTIGSTQEVFTFGYKNDIVNAPAGTTLRAGDTQIVSQDHGALVGAKLYMTGADARNNEHGDFTFYTGGTERMKILTGGQVVIGKSTVTANNFWFEVNNDGCAKPSGGSWWVSSDERLKENIVGADLETCYQNVKSIPLKFYKLRDEFITEEMARDRHMLGWIAQDVEEVFPKAIIQREAYGFEDCRSFNSDQIHASLYGAVQRMQQIIEDQSNRIASLEAYVTYTETQKVISQLAASSN